MRLGLALLFSAGLVIAACGSPRQPAASAAPARTASCDDGGSGGVIIDGVCL